MQDPKLIDVNRVIQQAIATSYTRPGQIMDQNQFNASMLKTLNRLSLEYSKGQRKFQVTQENEHFLAVVFAYLNRSESDQALTYTRKVRKSPESTELIDHTIVLSVEKGLLLLGPFGVGKTLLMTAIYQNRQHLGLGGNFVAARSIFDVEPKEMYSVVGSDYTGLFIDDLGAEPHRSVTYGSEDTPVGNLFMRRTAFWEGARIDKPERMKHEPRFIMSSNVSPEKLEKIYGGRVFSRIYGHCNVVISTQKTDFRKV